MLKALTIHRHAHLIVHLIYASYVVLLALPSQQIINS